MTNSCVLRICSLALLLFFAWGALGQQDSTKQNKKRNLPSKVLHECAEKQLSGDIASDKHITKAEKDLLCCQYGSELWWEPFKIVTRASLENKVKNNSQEWLNKVIEVENYPLMSWGAQMNGGLTFAPTTRSTKSYASNPNEQSLDTCNLSTHNACKNPNFSPSAGFDVGLYWQKFFYAKEDVRNCYSYSQTSGEAKDSIRGFVETKPFWGLYLGVLYSQHSFQFEDILETHALTGSDIGQSESFDTLSFTEIYTGIGFPHSVSINFNLSNQNKVKGELKELNEININKQQISKLSGYFALGGQFSLNVNNKFNKIKRTTALNGANFVTQEANGKALNVSIIRNIFMYAATVEGGIRFRLYKRRPVYGRISVQYKYFFTPFSNARNRFQFGTENVQTGNNQDTQLADLSTAVFRYGYLEPGIRQIQQLSLTFAVEFHNQRVRYRRFKKKK